MQNIRGLIVPFFGGVFYAAVIFLLYSSVALGRRSEFQYGAVCTKQKLLIVFISLHFYRAFKLKQEEI